MTYSYHRMLMLTGTSLSETERRPRETLRNKVFCVLTEIGVKVTMKKKLDAVMDGYPILGTCNPMMVWEAIGIKPRIGAILPCTVTPRGIDGGTEASAVDPVAPMSAADSAWVHAVASEVREVRIIEPA